MRLHRGRVGRFEPARRGGERFRGVAGAGHDLVLKTRCLTNVRVDLVHRRQPGPVRPLHLQLLRRADRVPFALSDDAEEVLAADDPGAMRRLAVAEQLRAEPRRPDHAAVQHPRHADVLNVEMLARHLARNVDARHRPADDLVLARRLRPRSAKLEPESGSLAFDGDRDAEQAAFDELAVGDSPRGVAVHADHAVFDGELAGGDIELRSPPGRATPAVPGLRPAESAGRRGRSSGCPRWGPGRRSSRCRP